MSETTASLILFFGFCLLGLVLLALRDGLVEDEDDSQEVL